MKMIRKAVTMLTLAVVAAATLGGVVMNAHAGNTVLGFKQLQWRDASAPGGVADTTFLTDESDTTRTIAFDTSDWDWGALAAAQGGVATGAMAARVIFVATALTNGVTDSIYFNVEKGTGRDSIFTANTTIAAAVGSVALPEGTVSSSATATSGTWTGVLMIDPDTPGASNVWMAPFIRLRVAGDQSGSSPKNSGLKVYIAYPKRAESQ